MTALWFACQTSSNSGVSRSGVLLALDVAKWPLVASIGARAGTYGAVGDPTGFALEHALETTQPFVVQSLFPNDRLRAQEGFFVAGALPKSGLAELKRRGPFGSLDIATVPGDPDALEKKLLADRGRGRPSSLPYLAVIIKPGLKQKLLGYLEQTYNRSAGVLFPDYAGFRTYGSVLSPVGRVGPP